jgi:hypothetical protein
VYGVGPERIIGIAKMYLGTKIQILFLNKMTYSFKLIAGNLLIFSVNELFGSFIII